MYCRKKIGLVCQLLAESAQILSYNSLLVYNSLSAVIHLYMIWAIAYTQLIFQQAILMTKVFDHKVETSFFPAFFDNKKCRIYNVILEA